MFRENIRKSLVLYRDHLFGQIRIVDIDMLVNEIMKHTFNDDYKVVSIFECCVERPIIVSRYFIIAFEFLISRWHIGLGQVGLLYKIKELYFVFVGHYHFTGCIIATVLENIKSTDMHSYQLFNQ